MQVSRLLYVIDSLIADYDAINSKLSALHSSLSNLASQPAEPTHEQAFHTAREEFNSELEWTNADAFPPSCSRILEELGGKGLFGQELRAAVEQLFSAVPFLPSTAQSDLGTIKKSLDQLVTHLKATQTALTEIGIESYEVADGTFDLGILIPDNITQTNVDVLNEELSQWSQHIKTVTEIASGQTGTTLHYNSVDSGSFDIFISIDPEGAIAMLTLIGGLMKLCQKLQDAKEKKEELENEGYPEKVIEAHEEHLGQIEASELANLQKSLIDKSPLEDARKNEMGKAVKLSLHYIYEQVKAGVDIEVMAPTTEDDEEAEEQGDIQVDESKLGFDMDSVPLYIQHAVSTATQAIEHARNREREAKGITHQEPLRDAEDEAEAEDDVGLAE